MLDTFSLALWMTSRREWMHLLTFAALKKLQQIEEKMANIQGRNIAYIWQCDGKGIRNEMVVNTTGAIGHIAAQGNCIQWRATSLIFIWNRICIVCSHMISQWCGPKFLHHLIHPHYEHLQYGIRKPLELRQNWLQRNSYTMPWPQFFSLQLLHPPIQNPYCGKRKLGMRIFCKVW